MTRLLAAAPSWLRIWLDNSAYDAAATDASDKVDWLRCAPFVAMHAACLAVFWVGWSPVAAGMAAFLYVARMFVITGFYHRYFAHRTFKTSRPMQAVMAVLGCTAVQRDPLWWAAHHVHHHAHSDEEQDPHSPQVLGFWKSHVGWFMTPAAFRTRESYVKDWLRFPELRWLNRYDMLPPLGLAVGLFAFGAALEERAPSLGTNGWQMVVWGFFLSTIVLHHGTFTINSLAHRFGSRRFATKDNSRNNWLLALLTLGEGWHNNHHHYPGAARQGFYWWEADFTFYGLKLFEALGLVWDLRPVPASALARNRIGSPEAGR